MPKTAFEKLINPVFENVNGFEWKRTFFEQTAYLSITTTDDQDIVHFRDGSHTSTPKTVETVQNQRCRRSPQERNPRQQIKRKTSLKEREKEKVNPKVHPLESTNRKERVTMLVEKPGIKELPLFPSHLPQLQVQRISMDKRNDPTSVFMTHHQRDLLVRTICIHIRMIQ